MSTVTITSNLGQPVPYLPHAISVSIPTWEDNRGFAEGEARVVDALTTGYPRFMLHESVKLVRCGVPLPSYIPTRIVR